MPTICRRRRSRRFADAALATAAALDTRGLVRVDLRLDDAGRPWVLELNAIPGLTPTSLAPLAARHGRLGRWRSFASDWCGIAWAISHESTAPLPPRLADAAAACNVSRSSEEHR